MRKTAFAAALAVVFGAGAGMASIPPLAVLEPDEDRLTPIAGTLPPLSEAEIDQRCRGFFRAMHVRHQLAQFMGIKQLDIFAFLADVPESQRTATVETGADFVTPYMVEFGPVNPGKTARSGLFQADRRACTAFLDATG